MWSRSQNQKKDVSNKFTNGFFKRKLDNLILFKTIKSIKICSDNIIKITCSIMKKGE